MFKNKDWKFVFSLIGTQKKVAEQMGLNSATVCVWLKNKRVPNHYIITIKNLLEKKGYSCELIDLLNINN